MERLDEKLAPRRLSWLQAARQQSIALAELRAAHPTPFAGRQRRPRAGRRRPLWLTAALAACVVGLATVTLATLHGRRGAPPPPARVEPLGSASAAGGASTSRTGGPSLSRPAALQPRQQLPQPVAKRRARPAARRAPRQQPAPAAAAPETPPEQVIFEGDEPGDSVIIVNPPPRRLGPIWTPQEYKKQRAGSQRW